MAMFSSYVTNYQRVRIDKKMGPHGLSWFANRWFITISGWWFGTFGLFSIIYGTILPID